MHARTFTKTFKPGRLATEAAGLDWLREAEPSGGTRVVGIVARRPDEQQIDLEYIDEGRVTEGMAERFGRSLAHTHARGDGWFGATPGPGVLPMWVHESPLPTFAEADAPATWGEFYGEHRVRPFLREAVDGGQFDAASARLLDGLCDRIAAGDFDSPQPALVTTKAARTHGDLWSGNVLWPADPQAPTGAVLIDPLAHGAHAETDLALLGVFGLARLETVLAAYDAESPLADGWRSRIGLHQLFPLMFHTAHFGGSYGRHTLEVARQYV